MENRFSDQAYDYIKDAICTGQYASGDILSEVALSRKLSMSRTPIHDACRRLEHEGFVEVKSGIGILVKSMSGLDIQNLYAVRTEMEVLAASTAIYNIPANTLNELEKEFLHLKEMFVQGKEVCNQTYLEVDWKLHKLLIDQCGNDYIQQIMRMIYSNIRRYQRCSYEALGNLPESVERHIKIIRLLQEKDIERVKSALRNNIETGKDFISPQE